MNLKKMLMENPELLADYLEEEPKNEEVNEVLQALRERENKQNPSKRKTEELDLEEEMKQFRFSTKSKKQDG